MKKYKLKFDNDGVEFVNLKIPKSFLNNFEIKFIQKLTLKIYFYPKENFQVLNRTKELIQDQGEILLKKWILTFFLVTKY